MRHLSWKRSGRSAIGLALASVLAAGVLQQSLAGPGGGTKVYLTEFRSGTVGVINAGDNTVTGHIPIPKGAHGIAVLRDGSRVFVSSDESSVISVIDPAADRVIGTIPTGKQPHGLATSPDGRFVFACIFGDDQVLEIDPHRLSVVRTFDAPGPHNLATGGDALYVAAQKPGETGVLRISLGSGKSEGFIRTETIPRSLNLSPDGRILVSTQADRNEVQFYSTNPLALTGHVQVGGAPHHVLFTPDGKSVLVVNQTTNDLSVIDASSMTVRKTIAVGKKPHWIAPTADGKYAYVTDETSDEVSLVDLEDGDVEQTIAVGGGPRKIAIIAGIAGTGTTGGGERTPGTMPAETMGKRVTVNIEGPPPRFAPQTVTIEAGTTIEWVNNGKGIHTVTDNDGAWDSGSLSPGERYSRQFDAKGTFGYYCVPHRSMGMVGTIVVK
jgi:YVTN family beta-propeller protein